MAGQENIVPLKPASQPQEKAAKSSTKKAPAKKASAKKTKTSSKAKPKRAAAQAKTTVKKKPATKKTAAKKTTAKKAAPKKAAPKKAASKKTAAKKPTAAKKTSPKKTVKAAAKKKAPARTQKAAAFSPLRSLATPVATPQNMESMMTQTKNQFDQLTKEASNVSRESFDVFSKSGAIFAKGFEEIIRESMAFAQNTAEKQMQFAKEAMSVKSVNEWSDVQNKIAQANFDDFMSSATKLSELGVKVLSDAVEPINEHVTKTVQKAGDAVAAE